MKQGYFINDTGYVRGYGQVEEGTPNFVESETLERKAGFYLKANKARTAIEYVPIGQLSELPQALLLPAEAQIRILKAQLAATDYQVIKFIEGVLTEEKFAPIRVERAAWRAKINELEPQCKKEV